MTYTDPTVRSQELGEELRALREAHGLSLVESAKHIDASASKLSRIETGLGNPTAEDVAALLVVYGVTGPQRRELLALAREAERRGWWQRNRTNYPQRLRTLMSLESKAASIVNFETVVVPGLLQTGEYTRALMRNSGQVPENEIENRMVTRLHRHSVLLRQHPPALVAVIDELVLHRLIGGQDILRRQLEHLAELAARDNITIRVLANNARCSAGADGSFIFVRRTGLSPVVFLDSLTSSLFLEEQQEINRYAALVCSLSEHALDARQSVHRISELARSLDTKASTT